MATFINLICSICNKEFQQSIQHYNRNISRNSKSYCSKECRNISNINGRKKISLVLLNCPICKKEFYRNKSDLNKTNYCSRECCDIDKKRDLLPLQRKCITCNKYFDVEIILAGKYSKKYSKKKYCSKKCIPSRIENENHINNPKTTKKGELFDRNNTWQGARSHIQQNARKIYFKNNPNSTCLVCNYDKHIEVAHIKSVSKFDKNATIEEINDIKNLVGLCPNHHWEFDNGLINLENPKEEIIINDN